MGLYGNEIFKYMSADVENKEINFNESVDCIIQEMEQFNLFESIVLEFSFDDVKKKIKEIWEKVKTVVSGIFKKIRDAIAGLFNKAKSVFSKKEKTLQNAKKVDEAKKNTTNESAIIESDENGEESNKMITRVSYYRWANVDCNAGGLSKSYFHRSLEKCIDTIDKAIKDFKSIDTSNMTLVKAAYVDLTTGSNSEIKKAVEDLDGAFPTDNNYGNSISVAFNGSYSDYAKKLIYLEQNIKRDIDYLEEQIKVIDSCAANPIGIDSKDDENSEINSMIVKINAASAQLYKKVSEILVENLSKVTKYYNGVTNAFDSVNRKLEQEVAKLSE